MKKVLAKNRTRNLRRRRSRAKIFGTTTRPRLSIFRSNQYIYAQLIDDEKGKTLVSYSSFALKKEKGAKKSDVAKAVGKKIAELAKTAGVSSVVLDRGAYRYHGRVKALADATREGGLKL